ncbi:MAG TPA: glycosyltransferase family A protein [Cyclobacteriaceae bacterium]|nr:glycosyltransferase family A protein [Cyclobacteriaceae bacterium]
MTTFFSIIVPSYNRAHLIKATLDSILSQTYSNFEVIVVDDGSTDNTGAVISTHFGHLSNIRYIRQQNSERAAARNRGSSLASGDYINFFDSDDLMLPNHLATAAAFIAKSGSEVFHLNYEIRDGSGKLLKYGPDMPTANRELIRGNFLSCNGVMIRRDVVMANPFDEDRSLSAMEDWELWLRLACRFPVSLVNTITSVIVNHEERSVLHTDGQKLIRRVESLISKVMSNKEIVQYYKNELSVFRSSGYTYVALHLAIMRDHRKESIRYAWRGLRENASFLFTRRFLAILKHLIL